MPAPAKAKAKAASAAKAEVEASDVATNVAITQGPLGPVERKTEDQLIQEAAAAQTASTD